MARAGEPAGGGGDARAGEAADCGGGEDAGGGDACPGRLPAVGAGWRWVGRKKVVWWGAYPDKKKAD